MSARLTGASMRRCPRRREASVIQKFMETLRRVGAEEYVRGLLLCFGAPTIRNLKAASLINFRREGEDLRALWNAHGAEWLEPLGVEWILLNEESLDGGALVMIYRRELLAQALSGDAAAGILRALGYPFSDHLPDVDACLEYLRGRFRSGCPHEVGLFLDYPPEDVLGFMERGKTARPLAVGYWKVYGNVRKARRTFRRYRRAEHDAARSLLCNI